MDRERFAGGVNLLTRPLPDRPDRPLFIVGAHYDSRAETPGADDNASGVAGLLELAASLGPVLSGRVDQAALTSDAVKTMTGDDSSLVPSAVAALLEPAAWAGPQLAAVGRCKARLQLAAYDREEDGLLGSAHHSGRIDSAVAGMISLEMLGYTDHRPGSQRLPPHLKGMYPDVGDFIGVVGNEASRSLVETVTAGLKRIDGLPVESMVVPGDGSLLPVTRLSDHASFWDRGLPALMITDTSFFRNPHYHQASDRPDTLDYGFLARVAAGVRVAVWDVLTG